MNTHKISCAQANAIDLIECLESLGYKPEKVRNNDYWYPSPLRQEKESSFKVNRKLNEWYNHGTGEGGNVVDFGILYHRCTVTGLLEKLNNSSHHFSFHKHNNNHPANQYEPDEKEKIVILDSRPVTSLPLQQYVHKRMVSVELANRYCREVDFELYGKKYTAIGFKNNSGGYELRSERFKGGSSPKDVTFINQNSNAVVVFEGFFSFLSYQSIIQNKEPLLTSFLALNSLAFFEKSRLVLEKHDTINLYLDRDQTGMKVTQDALANNPQQYNDCSHLYDGFKDLNDRLTKTSLIKKQGLIIRRSF